MYDVVYFAWRLRNTVKSPVAERCVQLYHTMIFAMLIHVSICLRSRFWQHGQGPMYWEHCKNNDPFGQQSLPHIKAKWNLCQLQHYTNNEKFHRFMKTPSYITHLHKNLIFLLSFFCNHVIIWRACDIASICWQYVECVGFFGLNAKVAWVISGVLKWFTMLWNKYLWKKQCFYVDLFSLITYICDYKC